MTSFVRQIRGRRSTRRGCRWRSASGCSPRGPRCGPRGLGDLAGLVVPVRADEGGCGVAYFNWGIDFYTFMPFDSEIASLVAATPAGTPFYLEVSSWTWTGVGPTNAACSHEAKVRTTKKELWTTALVAKEHGARGLSAFNFFVYTREFYDFPCECEENKPYCTRSRCSALELAAGHGQERDVCQPLRRPVLPAPRGGRWANGGGIPATATLGQHSEAALRVVMVPSRGTSTPASSACLPPRPCRRPCGSP